MSPPLLPKPRDWAGNVNVYGFVFDEVPASYVPPAKLVSLVEAEETPPVYVGLGSTSFANTRETFGRIFRGVKRDGRAGSPSWSYPSAGDQPF